MKRFVPLALALASCGPSLEIDPGCEVELASRPRIEGDTIVVEVWVTAFYETRAIDIPSCALISIDDRPALPCGDDGLPDPSGCQPALFDLRGDTSVQVAQIEIPLAGDACNEPLEPGAYPVGIHGIETGDYEVCQRLGVLVVP
ncbi:MAG: hypothetical protein H6737_05520 [Alphaproteobacteria bacterium]|nr:hypothetical protein [Alphaproteobacteria bacterium]